MKRWLLPLCLTAGLAMAQDFKEPPPQETPELPPAVPASSDAPPSAAPGTSAEASPPPAAAPLTMDKAIPQAYTEEHYASTWSRNPFLIETKGPEGPAGPGFADDWELKGLTRLNGEPQALLGNRKTQEFHTVHVKEDKDGFKLLEANFAKDMHQSSVKVAKAGESGPATFKFPDAPSSPVGAAARPGMPMGQAQQRPGAYPSGMTPAQIQQQQNAAMLQQQQQRAAGQPVNPMQQQRQPSYQQGVAPPPMQGAQPTAPSRRRTLIPQKN